MTEIKNTPYISAGYELEILYNVDTNSSQDGISTMREELAKSFVRLDEIETLQDDWNGNGASAFSADIIDRVRELVSTLNIQPIILPTARDSIQMEYENEKGDYLELELFEGGRLKLFSYSHDGVSETRDISIAEADKVVCSFY